MLLITGERNDAEVDLKFRVSMLARQHGSGLLVDLIFPIKTTEKDVQRRKFFGIKTGILFI